MKLSDIYKRRKEVYLYTEFDDVNLEYKYIPMDKEDLILQIFEFFKNGSLLIYPAKSYFVALVYAAAMEKYFHIDFFEALDSKELLFDDKYFVPYSKAKDIYNAVIFCMNGHEQILNYVDAIHPTIDYFKEEFSIKD